MSDWAGLLRDLREKESLSRGDLAGRADVAPATVKAYELGLRQPSRRLLVAILDALKADMHTRQEIMSGAGFAPDFQTPSDRVPDEWLTLQEATTEMEAAPFPSCLSIEVLEVVAANVLMQRVWEVDFSRELDKPFERSMFSMLSTPRVADHILNWDEAVSLVISIVKGNYGGEAAFSPANPYFAAAVEHFLSGDKTYVQRFLALWARVPGARRKLRFTYPVVWRHSEVGVLRFLVIVNPGDARGSFTFNDWIAADAATMEGLAHLAAMQDGLVTLRS
jgi:transcriptional regulator with XRE-family HTH domain